MRTLDEQMRMVTDKIYYLGRVCIASYKPGYSYSPGGGSTSGSTLAAGRCRWRRQLRSGSAADGPGVFPCAKPLSDILLYQRGLWDPCLAEFLTALWGCLPIPNPENIPHNVIGNLVPPYAAVEPVGEIEMRMEYWLGIKRKYAEFIYAVAEPCRIGFGR